MLDGLVCFLEKIHSIERNTNLCESNDEESYICFVYTDSLILRCFSISSPWRPSCSQKATESRTGLRADSDRVEAFSQRIEKQRNVSFLPCPQSTHLEESYSRRRYVLGRDEKVQGRKVETTYECICFFVDRFRPVTSLSRRARQTHSCTASRRLEFDP